MLRRLARIVSIGLLLVGVPSTARGQSNFAGNWASSNRPVVAKSAPIAASYQPSAGLQQSSLPGTERHSGRAPASSASGSGLPAGASRADGNRPAVASDAWNHPSGAAGPGEPATSGPAQSGRAGPSTDAIPLRPPKSARQLPGAIQRRAATGPSLVTVGSSLAVVLGIFLLTAWFLRRNTPGAFSPLPSEVFEVLGRGSLGGQQQVQLVRCGNRILLLAVGSAGPETLCEITDPDEVTQLIATCRQGRPDSSSGAFRQMLEQLSGGTTRGKSRAM